MTPLEQFIATQAAFREDPSPMKALAYVRDARSAFAGAPELGEAVDEVLAWFDKFEAGPDLLDDTRGWIRHLQEKTRDFDKRFDDRFGRRPGLRRHSTLKETR